MKRTFLLFFVGLLLPAALFSQDFSASNHSVVSSYDFNETLKRLKETFQEKNITLFAEIDHKVQAEKVNLKLPQATVLLVGNPKAGTPLMQQNIEIAIELPLKILVFEKEAAPYVYVHFKETVPLAQTYFHSSNEKLKARLQQIDDAMKALIKQAITVE